MLRTIKIFLNFDKIFIEFLHSIHGAEISHINKFTQDDTIEKYTKRLYMYGRTYREYYFQRTLKKWMEKH